MQLMAVKLIMGLNFRISDYHFKLFFLGFGVLKLSPGWQLWRLSPLGVFRVDTAG